MSQGDFSNFSHKQERNQVAATHVAADAAVVSNYCTNMRANLYVLDQFTHYTKNTLATTFSEQFLATHLDVWSFIQFKDHYKSFNKAQYK